MAAAAGFIALSLVVPPAWTQAPLEPAHRDANHWRPTWSPDGTRIAFSAFDAGGDYELYVVTVSDGAIRQLTNNDARDFRPKWSPDGHSIAFSSDRDGNSELYTIDVETGVERRLTDTPAGEERSSWSPDGKSLVYDSGAGGEWDLWILDVDSRERRRLTDFAGFEGYPAWGRNGRIAFTSDRHAPGVDTAREIYTIEPATGRVDRLTNNDATDQSPDWSPDGSRIAFFSQRDGNPEIYVMRADGTEPHRLTNDPEWDFMPAWSPDGRWIAFDSRRDGRRGIFVMRADGSRVRKLTNRELSPFVAAVRSNGVDPALARLHEAVAGGQSVDSFFLEAEVLSLARGAGTPLDALKLLDLNVRAHPRSVTGWTALADALAGLSMPVAARRAYLEALAIDPSAQAALTGLARTTP